MRSGTAALACAVALAGCNNKADVAEDKMEHAAKVQAQAAGATAAFDKVYEQYRLAPEVTRKRMYLETMESVLGKVDTTVIEAPGVQAYLPLPEVQRRNRQAQEAQQ